MDKVHLSLNAVFELANRCLLVNGCNMENAEAVAAIILAAERDGSSSHGLFRLPGYVASLRSRKVDGNAVPEVERLAPGVVQVDGGGGYAPLALQIGRPVLIEAAQLQGLAALALTNVHHFGALWIEVEAIAREGLVAFAFTSYTPSVAPAGSGRPFFGTNPMAFAWPRRDQPPMVFDQASAAMAKGEVMIAARDGHELPPGVGLDSSGEPTVDPQAILDGGTMLPFGGYKGSAIAMMIELLAGSLIGQAFSFEAGQRDNKDGGPPRGGELMLAMDPEKFGDAAGWMDHCESFFEQLLTLDGTRLPGSRRYKNRESRPRDGVWVPEELHKKIETLCSA